MNGQSFLNKFLLPLIVVALAASVSGCAKAEAREQMMRSPYVWVDAKRHVACYSIATPYEQSNGGVAVSCVALDSTNSHAIGR